MENNFAYYIPSRFAIEISKINLQDDNVLKEDLPTYIHEYCHYIQDITTITGIFGFSLLLRDIVELTQIFSQSQGETYSIPLELDKFDKPYGKYRPYYNKLALVYNCVFFIIFIKKI